MSLFKPTDVSEEWLYVGSEECSIGLVPVDARRVGTSSAPKGSKCWGGPESKS